MTREYQEFEDISRAVGQHLRPLGFKKRGACWNRLGGVVDVIDLQRSKSLDMITLNVGVLDREIYTLVWGKEPGSFVFAAGCTVSARIGQLIHGHDKWWPLGSPTVLTEILGLIDSTVLPFFARMRTRDSMEEWLDSKEGYIPGYPPPVMSLALIKNSLGHKDEAIRLLNQLNSARPSAWKPRIDELSRSITS